MDSIFTWGSWPPQIVCSLLLLWSVYVEDLPTIISAIYVRSVMGAQCRRGFEHRTQVFCTVPETLLLGFKTTACFEQLHFYYRFKVSCFYRIIMLKLKKIKIFYIPSQSFSSMLRFKLVYVGFRATVLECLVLKTEAWIDDWVSLQLLNGFWFDVWTEFPTIPEMALNGLLPFCSILSTDHPKIKILISSEI